MNENSNISLEAQQVYYDKRWPVEAERPNRLELWRLVEILRSLVDTDINFAIQNIKICDLGCGRGWIAQHLSDFGDVTGVDLSAEGVKQAQSKWPHIRFEQGDITKYRSDEKFDIIISSEVIEHVEDKKAFFDTARSLLKPGGHFIVTTPNPMLYKHYVNSDAEIQPLEFWPSLAEIRRLATPDFSIVRHETFIFDFFYTGIFRIISAPKLIRLCRSLHVEWLRQWLHCRFNLGLHQIFHAKFKGQ